MNNDHFLSSRKFVLTCLAFISVTVLSIMQIVPVNEYLDFLKWALGIYTTGNVLSKLTSHV